MICAEAAAPYGWPSGVTVQIAAFGRDILPCAGKLADCRLGASAHLSYILLQVDRSDPRNIEAGNITPDNAEKKVGIQIHSLCQTLA